MIIEFGAGFLDCFIWLDCAVCVDLDLDLLFKRMRFLVASEADPVILQELVADDVAQGVVLLLDEDGASVLTSSIINTLDKVAWLDLS